MKTVLRTKRIAPLALAVLAAVGLLAGCSHDNGNADTGDNMAATTPAAPNATTPADTSATPVRPGTSCGVGRFVVVPSPSCPCSLLPNAHTEPVLSTASEWPPPASMRVMNGRPLT